MSNDDDLKKARRGDRDALDRLLRRNEEKFQKLAMSRLGQHLKGKVRLSDILQSTYLDAIKGLPRFRGETDEAFVAWVAKILDNNIRDKGKFFQRTKRKTDGEADSEQLENSPPIAPDATPSVTIGFADEMALVGRALKSLSDEYAKVIELHLIQGLDYDRCAEAMGRSSTAMRVLFSRAKAALVVEVERLRNGGKPKR